MNISVQSIIDTFTHVTSYYWDFTLKELANPSWHNHFYWIIFWCLVCFSLEAIFPKRIEYGTVKRKGFWLDLFYVFFYDFVFMGLGFMAFTVIVEQFYLLGLHSIGIEQTRIFNIQEYHWILQVGLLFIVQDFMEFLAHYLMHRSDFLWAFHKIHHAQEEIGFASSRHFHWGEYFVFKPLLYIPFSLIGYSAGQYVFFQLTIVYFTAFFTHCNIKTNFGFFNYIINNPETHLWHHAKNVPIRYGVNYASVLNIWDWMFGTFYLPKNKKDVPILGVDDNDDVPKSFLMQMIYPFTYLWNRRKTGTTNVYAHAEMQKQKKQKKKAKHQKSKNKKK